MIQVPLDTPVDEVDAVVLVAGDDVLVVACEPGRDNPAARRGVVAAGEVRVRQWRNSGPFPDTADEPCRPTRRWRRWASRRS